MDRCNFPAPAGRTSAWTCRFTDKHRVLIVALSRTAYRRPLSGSGRRRRGVRMRMFSAGVTAWCGVAALAAVITTMLVAVPAGGAAAPSAGTGTTPAAGTGFWHTSGNQILDSTG